MIFKLKREEAGLTQMDMAKRCGVTKQFINAIEKGKSSCPLEIKIAYLELNPTEKDNIIIEYLKKESNDARKRKRL